jgi:hypothetical protein
VCCSLPAQRDASIMRSAPQAPTTNRSGAHFASFHPRSLSTTRPLPWTSDIARRLCIVSRRLPVPYPPPQSITMRRFILPVPSSFFSLFLWASISPKGKRLSPCPVEHTNCSRIVDERHCFHCSDSLFQSALLINGTG